MSKFIDFKQNASKHKGLSDNQIDNLILNQKPISDYDKKLVDVVADNALKRILGNKYKSLSDMLKETE